MQTHEISEIAEHLLKEYLREQCTTVKVSGMAVHPLSRDPRYLWHLFYMDRLEIALDLF